MIESSVGERTRRSKVSHAKGHSSAEIPIDRAINPTQTLRAVAGGRLDMLDTKVGTPDEAALLISPLESDRDFLQEVFSGQGWTLYCVPSLGSALKLLRNRVASVVMTDTDLPVGTWKDVVGLTRFLPIPPFVIVVAFEADRHLYGEALRLGARDVLMKPFNKAEVVRVLKLLWNRPNRVAST